jgi:hypothetical protein
MPDQITVIWKKLGKVIANANLNVRQGSPSTNAVIACKATRGTSLSVTGLVEGDSIAGNAQWYAGDDGVYFWSGAVGSFFADPQVDGLLKVERRANGTVRPLDDKQIRGIYGDVSPMELTGGRVKLDPAWITTNIVDLSVPALASCGVSTIQVHRKAQAAFHNAFDQISRQALSGLILTFGGTWVPRHKGWNSKRELSAHTWGIAIDINVAWNGYGKMPTPLGGHGSVQQLVSIFESVGFAWGGYFEPLAICDGMHFELARTDL